MDKITKDSPKRLLVVDAVDDIAQQLFGEKYDYYITTTQYDPLEYLNKLKKPRWTTVLGEESTVLFDMGKTLANDVLVNVVITAPVQDNHLAQALPYLEDIEQFKHELIGQEIEHKENVIYGNVQTEDYPAWSASHEIDFTAKILRIVFAVVLRIFDEALK
jgi:hypothetical protein